MVGPQLEVSRSVCDTIILWESYGWVTRSVKEIIKSVKERTLE